MLLLYVDVTKVQIAAATVRVSPTIQHSVEVACSPSCLDLPVAPPQPVAADHVANI